MAGAGDESSPATLQVAPIGVTGVKGITMNEVKMTVREMVTRIDYMITGGALVVILAAMGAFGPLAPVMASQSVPAAPVTASAVVTSARTNTPTDESPFYAFSYGEAAEVGGVSGLDAFDAFKAAGATGALNDGTDDVLYVRIGTVVDLEYGTATMTVYGASFCIDETDEYGRCSGGEFMTDDMLGYGTIDTAQI